MSGFCNHIRQHSGIFATHAWELQGPHCFVQQRLGEVVRVAGTLALPVRRPYVTAGVFSHLPRPPPVPEFEGVRDFVGAGNGVIQILATKNEGEQQAKPRRGGSGSGGSGKGDGPKRRRGSAFPGMCHQFDKDGTCTYGADCQFIHEGVETVGSKHGRGERGRRSGRGSGSSSGGGGSAGGSGSGDSSGGAWSALVVRGRN